MKRQISQRLHALRTRLGDLWWYSALLFIAFRLADAVNFFTGIWLVPRYVDAAELGAVLPLTQVGAVLGIPLSILLLPFSKFLNRYAARGEWGKVKSLLRDVFLLSGAVFVAVLGLAWVILPAVFVRMRVESGRLGLLIVTSGIVTALLPVFTSALQALKRFNVISLNAIVSAPLRFAAMLVALPFRGLSGYFVGQIVPAFYAIGATCLSLRGLFSSKTPFEPYFKEDFLPMARYLLPVAAMVAAATLQSGVETFVIRHRLPDSASAEFYIISRFAEIAAYAGATLALVLFPLAAERPEEQRFTTRLLRQAVAGTAVAGFGFALLLTCFGDALLSLMASTRPYAGAAGRMGLLAAIYALRTCVTCYTNCEIACGRFAFLRFWCGVIVVEAALLYGLNGYTFFYGILPDGWVDAVARFNPARIEFVLGAMLGVSLLQAAATLPALLRRRETAQGAIRG